MSIDRQQLSFFYLANQTGGNAIRWKLTQNGRVVDSSRHLRRSVIHFFCSLLFFSVVVIIAGVTCIVFFFSERPENVKSILYLQLHSLDRNNNLECLSIWVCHVSDESIPNKPHPILLRSFLCSGSNW